MGHFRSCFAIRCARAGNGAPATLRLRQPAAAAQAGPSRTAGASGAASAAVAWQQAASHGGSLSGSPGAEARNRGPAKMESAKQKVYEIYCTFFARESIYKLKWTGNTIKLHSCNVLSASCWLQTYLALVRGLTRALRITLQISVVALDAIR